VPLVGPFVAAILGYLVGAIPSGVMVGRLRGIDPRAGGSGRTGATNAFRTLGAGLAVVVLAADVIKGAAAVWLGAAVAGALDGSPAWGAALGGIGAVVGHVRSIFIGFTGGRGVATGGGAMLVLAPLAVLPAVPVLALAIWRTRYVSLGSVLAAATVAAAAVVLAMIGAVPAESALAAVVIGGVVILAHADNIARLRAGTERRLGSG
jgi:acyl phosphate:glycerol-3-phosphate acyltransferase